jgi:hypothetical protein
MSGSPFCFAGNGNNMKMTRRLLFASLAAPFVAVRKLFAAPVRSRNYWLAAGKIVDTIPTENIRTICRATGKITYVSRYIAALRVVDETHVLWREGSA